MGTWIEILAELMYQIELAVVPHVGTWIEIASRGKSASGTTVVPHVGTWIEIGMYGEEGYVLESFPTWERGLK